MTELFTKEMEQCKAVRRLTLLLFCEQYTRKPEKFAALMDGLKDIERDDLVKVARNGLGFDEEYVRLIRAFRGRKCSFPERYL